LPHFHQLNPDTPLFKGADLKRSLLIQGIQEFSGNWQDGSHGDAANHQGCENSLKAKKIKLISFEI